MTVDEMIAKKNEYGLSNKKLAELSGMPLGTVQKIMSKSTKSPRFQSLDALESVFIEKERGFLSARRSRSD